ncbi:MAG: AAA family ATPase [Candidatus Woesearchaeota archaeon]
MKVIIVSGTPGTGKTTIAKKIAKEKKYEYIDVNKVIEKQNKKYNIISGFDKKRDSKIIDIDNLNNALIELIKNKQNQEKNKEKKTKGLIIDSHLAHYLPKEYVDLCIITKCDLKELKKRLEKRKYSKNKVRENLDAEIFDVCRIEALEKGHKVKIINTTYTTKETKKEKRKK